MKISAGHVTSEVAAVMGDLLASTPLAADDDFFLRGGDSQLAIDLISTLMERFEVPESNQAELSSALLIGLFDDATPETLAAIIEKHLSEGHK